MKSYRAAILGCRNRGTSIARAYHAHPRTQVVGLCDLIPARAESLGKEIGVNALFTDYDEMIRQTEPDIVAIPTGTDFHHPLAMGVLRHGVHIEVEKPICTDLEQADEIIALAREKGVRTAVHHQGRVGPSLRAVARELNDGRIGNLRYLTASGKGYYGGFGLMNIGTHLLNSMLELAGSCRRVTALAVTGGRPVRPEDVLAAPSGMGVITGEHITATLQFDENVTATLLQHRFDPRDSTAYQIEIFGSTGRLRWTSRGVWWLPAPHYRPDKEADWQRLEVQRPPGYDAESPAKASDFAFVHEYVQALDQDREHTCSGAQGRHVLEIIMGIFESAAYGRTVELPQAHRDHPLLRWRQEAGLEPPGPMPRDRTEWYAVEDRRLGRSG